MSTTYKYKPCVYPVSSISEEENPLLSIVEWVDGLRGNIDRLPSFVCFVDCSPNIHAVMVDLYSIAELFRKIMSQEILVI